MKYNQDILDTLTLVSFLISVANYNENLTQSDKDDLMAGLDKQTAHILGRIQEELEKQNEVLEEQTAWLKYIAERLWREKNEHD